jgi:hypothetical protein
MAGLFLIVEAVCFGYFVISRRRFDLFAVANLGAAFYMLPLLIGRLPSIGAEGVVIDTWINLDPGCTFLV